MGSHGIFSAENPADFAATGLHDPSIAGRSPDAHFKALLLLVVEVLGSSFWRMPTRRRHLGCKFLPVSAPTTIAA
jgi:hypothetical protein